MVLPGGESTTMRIASRYESLLAAVFDWMDAHPQRPVLGTCAGAILLASPGEGRSPYLAAGIARNAWGRQRDSFEAVVDVELDTPESTFKPSSPSVETVFLTSRWRWPHRALLDSPTASRACSFGPPI